MKTIKNLIICVLVLFAITACGSKSDDYCSLIGQSVEKIEEITNSKAQYNKGKKCIRDWSPEIQFEGNLPKMATYFFDENEELEQVFLFIDKNADEFINEIESRITDLKENDHGYTCYYSGFFLNIIRDGSAFELFISKL